MPSVTFLQRIVLPWVKAPVLSRVPTIRNYPEPCLYPKLALFVALVNFCLFSSNGEETITALAVPSRGAKGKFAFPEAAKQAFSSINKYSATHKHHPSAAVSLTIDTSGTAVEAAHHLHTDGCWMLFVFSSRRL